MEGKEKWGFLPTWARETLFTLLISLAWCNLYHWSDCPIIASSYSETASPKNMIGPQMHWQHCRQAKFKYAWGESSALSFAGSLGNNDQWHRSLAVLGFFLFE